MSAANGVSTGNVDAVATLRAYYKLCVKPEHRPIVLKDKVFVSMLNTLLADKNADVIRYVVKILLVLTERTEDAAWLATESDLTTALNSASDRVFTPSINFNLALVCSRLSAVEPRKEEKLEDPLALAVKELDKGGSLHRKFVGRKSKQLVYEFDGEEFTETKKREVERALLAKKGVISVYFTEATHPRAVLRTIPTIDSNTIAELLFSCGCDYVVHVVKIDGTEERFEMYASERNDKVPIKLPDYLEDDALHCDPQSCVITNEMAAHNKATGGWFSSISSFVKIW